MVVHPYAASTGQASQPHFVCFCNQYRERILTAHPFVWGVLKGLPSCIGLTPEQTLGTVSLGGVCVMPVLGAVGTVMCFPAPLKLTAYGRIWPLLVWFGRCAGPYWLGNLPWWFGSGSFLSCVLLLETRVMMMMIK